MAKRMPNNDLVRILRTVHLADNHMIRGRIHLQKIVYLLKQLSKITCGDCGFEYSFDFYNYGVFSKELAKDTTYLSKETRYLSEEEPQDEYAPWKYSVDIDAEIEKDFPSCEELFGLEQKEIKMKIEFLVMSTGKHLECLSTIVFLVNDVEGYKYSTYKDSVEYKNLKAKVKELKPHVIEIFDDSMKIAKDYVI